MSNVFVYFLLSDYLGFISTLYGINILFLQALEIMSVDQDNFKTSESVLFFLHQKKDLISGL